jgi:putative membrane protein
MNLWKNRKRTGQFITVALVAFALSGCATSREQPATSDSASAVTAQPAGPTAKPAKAKPAETSATPSAQASSKSTSAAILEQIHHSDLKEIAIGKIAEEKASTSEVRAYAEQLVADHTNVDQTVVAMAQKLGAHVHDAEASKEGRRRSVHEKLTEQKMSRTSGAEFDRLFLGQTTADHEKLIGALKQDREDASNDDIETLIDKILPILEQHQQLAQILMKKEQA